MTIDKQPAIALDKASQDFLSLYASVEDRAEQGRWMFLTMCFRCNANGTYNMVELRNAPEFVKDVFKEKLKSNDKTNA